MRSLHVAYSAGWIDGDTFGGGDVAIESDLRTSTCRDIAEEDVFVDERVTGSRIRVNK